MPTTITHIFEAITYLLTQDHDVSTIVGTKVFNGWRPTKGADAPCINHFEVISTKMDFGLFSGCQLQINCWHTNYKSARQLADAVVKKLNHYGGKVNGTFHIDALEYANRKDELVEPDVGLINVAVFFNCLYRADN